MRAVKLLMLVGLIGFSCTAQAENKMLEMVTQKGCFICHSVQAKTGPAIPLAPAYADIAERFKDKTDAVSYLAQRILKGTIDTQQDWSGQVNMRFMPPNLNVTAEEATQLATWVMSIKKDTISEEVIKHEGMLGLAAQNGCIACHGMSKEADSHYIPLAPPFSEVSARYKGNAEAKAVLAESIVQGTVNKEKKWPDVNMRFMPPNPTLKQEDVDKLVEWILSL